MSITFKAQFESDADMAADFGELQFIGTSDHNKLANRNAANQHPMSAITGLENALSEKQPKGNYLIKETDPTVPAWAKQPKKPAYTAIEVGADPVGSANTALKSAQEYTGKRISEIPSPDWNQNDETAKDHIKNRPFYEETTETVLLPDTVVDCTGEMEAAVVSGYFAFVEGDTYIVTWDGVEYECVAERWGNIAYLNAGPCGIIPEDGYLLVESGVGPVKATMSISHMKSGIKKLDRKYLDLPGLELTATFADGTVRTYTLYGEAVDG